MWIEERNPLGIELMIGRFGNAKTVRNDNSSRFGKLMKLQMRGVVAKGTKKARELRVCRRIPGRRE